MQRGSLPSRQRRLELQKCRRTQPSEGVPESMVAIVYKVTFREFPVASFHQVSVVGHMVAEDDNEICLLFRFNLAQQNHIKLQ